MTIEDLVTIRRALEAVHSEPDLDEGSVFTGELIVSREDVLGVIDRFARDLRKGADADSL